LKGRVTKNSPIKWGAGGGTRRRINAKLEITHGNHFGEKRERFNRGAQQKLNYSDSCIRGIHQHGGGGKGEFGEKKESSTKDTRVSKHLERGKGKKGVWGIERLNGGQAIRLVPR